MLKWVVFSLLALIVLVVSLKSLRHPNSHGFWRFFAWELILVLAAINLETWFVDPFSWHQIISWLLLIISFVPLIFGILSLKSKGKAAARREGEPQLLAFEKTTQLVTSGIYRYIRHPLYSSLLLLTWGVFFKSPAWLGGGLALAASVCLFFTAKADEAECIRFFGESYREYMKISKRFIPGIF
jgi:protein-S-isoprenylcysteine O-methyltransferase Ste14